MVKFHTVPIDYNGFGASFTPNSYFSRETWKRLFVLVDLDWTLDLVFFRSTFACS